MRLVIGGGGSEIALITGMLTASLPQLEQTGVTFTGADGTSAGAITAALFVSGYNTGGLNEALRRVNGFYSDLKNSGWHHTLARHNPLFWFLSPDDRSRLWTKNLLLTHKLMNEFSRASHLPSLASSPVQSALLTLLKKHIPDLSALQNGPMDITINTMSINPKTGDRTHHIHAAEDINYDTIIASTALANLGAKFLNGEHHFDGGHLKNGFLTSALSDETATDILVLSTYPTHHDIQSSAQHGEPVKQGELHHDVFKAYMDDNNHHHFHGIAPEVHEAGDIDRMRNDPTWMKERFNVGINLGREWARAHAQKVGHESTYIFPDALKNSVIFGRQRYLTKEAA